MSTKASNHKDGKPSTTSSGSHSEEAQRLAQEIRDLRGHVQGFEPLSSDDKVRYVSKYAMDPQAIEVATNLVELRPEISKMAGFDPTQARDAIRREAAYDRVESEAEALLEGIHGMRVVVYSAAADGAFRVLAAARGIHGSANVDAMTKEEKAAHEELAQRIETLSVALQKRRKTSDVRTARKKAVDEAATTEPVATQPAPTTGN